MDATRAKKTAKFGFYVFARRRPQHKKLQVFLKNYFYFTTVYNAHQSPLYINVRTLKTI